MIARLDRANVHLFDASEEERRDGVVRTSAMVERAMLLRAVRRDAGVEPLQRGTEMNKAVKVSALSVIGSLFAITVWAGVIAAQQTPAVETNAPGSATASNQFATIATLIAGFASMLAAQAFQWFRESRTRKWDLADRMAARKEVRDHAETQRLETIQAAIELARVSNINRDHLVSEIGRNTILTAEAAAKADAAYVSANNFNAKLEALHRQLVEMQRAGIVPDHSKEGPPRT